MFAIFGNFLFNTISEGDVIDPVYKNFRVFHTSILLVPESAGRKRGHNQQQSGDGSSPSLAGMDFSNAADDGAITSPVKVSKTAQRTDVNLSS